MPSLTIRAVPEAVVARVKAAAARHGVSMEQELRGMLERTYADKGETLRLLRALWPERAEVSPATLKQWRDEGRP
jgi:plasmid stability protein